MDRRFFSNLLVVQYHRRRRFVFVIAFERDSGLLKGLRDRKAEFVQVYQSRNHLLSDNRQVSRRMVEAAMFGQQQPLTRRSCW